MAEAGGGDRESLFCDTNIFVRFLTDSPPDQAAAAENVLTDPSAQVILTDVVVAEAVFVLTGFAGFDRESVADAIGRTLELPSVAVADEFVIRDALALWVNARRLHFVDAYLAALDRRTTATAVLSFDRDFDGIEGVERVDPSDPRTY